MHLLAARPGAVIDGAAVDLDQPPGDVLVLSAADSELAGLAAAYARLDPAPYTLRLASLLKLTHPLSVDLYLEKTAASARLIVVRLLGGRSYWAYGVDEIVRLGAARGVAVALLPGDDLPDADLAAASTAPPEACERLKRFFGHGGIDNLEHLLRYAATLIGRDAAWREPRPLPRAGFYWPGAVGGALDDVRKHWTEGNGVAALVFYRALAQSGNLAAIDALVEALQGEGLNPMPLFVTSLKEPLPAATVAAAFEQAPPDVILNTTGFAVAAPGERAAEGPFAAADCPVLQVILSGSDEARWRDGTHGLSAADIAMNVALPEVDGRIITRAVSFKSPARRDEATACELVGYEPQPDRIAFVARLAASWVRLRRTPPAERRIAIVLSNYPNRDGRIGNGVGLDTPASAITVLDALGCAGYRIEDAPPSGGALIDRLTRGPTNDLAAQPFRLEAESLSFAAYSNFFAGLPASVRDAVTARWGSAESDPYYRPGALDCGRFVVPAICCGSVAFAVQPARGYNIDPAASYHDPDLVPPHHYLATYAWLREAFGAHAIVHLGKHGNLEWLPGKALALSKECFPEAAFGPVPNLYPFIVNDPGEGAQAKRRAQAVIVDHLTPPLARAESYGPLAALERLIDEYYEASGVDPRRLATIAEEILSLARVGGLADDCGVAVDDGEDEALAKLDRYLCELKEMQIRDGLHVFGLTPEAEQLHSLLAALARLPRGGGEADASILRALADDLGLGFDPLDCDLAEPWTAPRPEALAASDPWRTTGDAVERLEALALALIARERAPHPDWTRTLAVLEEIGRRLRPAVEGSGRAELDGLLRGLDGRFVPPGPSGAPTRGRPDVLPTGRNFYSIDTRTAPTPAAWTLGWRSAALLIETYAQEHGEYPRSMAVTAWGTSNMRTGGDDIAQALALIGARPTWDPASRRVTGFEVLPAGVLGRPRVDVTLRISGFFRDAFPNLVELFDAAVRAVAATDETAEDNPIASRVRADRAALAERGADPIEAERLAGARVFGSKPGAYGAGLQALIDERGWRDDGDLARAYVAWGGWAYGGGLAGRPAHDAFEARLKGVQAVVQNQDNREHDLLDSDDYYQFEGGMTAAVRVLSGAQPATYHADHSRPERPVIRALEDEVARVVRARVVNPKWIAGVMRHGYKGAFEMAATVDYLFAFAATARCVADHHFDAVYQAYIDDDRVREFVAENNPAALREMSERLIEAQDRGLWRPAINAAYDTLRALAFPEADAR